MRILIAAGEAPLPPLNGYRLWLTHLSAQLAERHDVCVVAYREADQYGDPPPGLELVTLERSAEGRAARARAYAVALATRTPSWVGPHTDPISGELRRLAAERRFDIAYVGGVPLIPAAAALGDTPTLIVPLESVDRNIEARARIEPPPTSWLLGIQARFTRRMLANDLGRFGAAVVVSDEDAARLRELDPRVAVEVIPNGVDADRFAPAPGVRREPGLIVFTGAMHWPPNVTAASFAAREVMPRVRAEFETARLAIVGRDPIPEVRALGRLDGVDVVGEVPDIREWLWRAEVFLCPMVSGTGIKNKLLEALATETPAVVTPLSCQGLRVRSGEHLMVGGSSGDLAAATVKLLGAPDVRALLGAAARRYVVENHSWTRVADAYEALSKAVIAGQGGRVEDDRAAGAGRFARPARSPARS